MPKIGEIPRSGHEKLDLPGLPWLQEALHGGLVRGGVYLLAGEPGIGKTTLAVQILADLSKRGIPSLYLTNEQSLNDIVGVVDRVTSHLPPQEASAVKDNLFCDDAVAEVKDLPDFLARRVLSEGQEYHGSRIMVFDSIQGRGLAATATQQYRSLYRFNDLAKNAGLCSLLIGHITKRGQIAGPKDLEHNIDAVIYLRRAFRLRPLFVPKNRFGPALFDPLVLTMDDHGRLSKAPHTTAQSSTVFGWSGIGERLTEAQATVSLPRYGSSPELNAPNLPRARVKQLMNTISQLKDVDVTNLSYNINCYLPGRERYAEELDLPIAIALLSSYLQHPVPSGSLFVGELDLTSRIRPPEPQYLAELAQVLVRNHLGTIQHVYLAADLQRDMEQHLAEQIKAAREEGIAVPQGNHSIQVHGVRNLSELLNLLWSDIGVTT
jgi:DNA repair protein RadA/Sms